jgi:hypothetical protein
MIDLDTAKAHLRVETAAEDTIIGAYLAAAIADVEDATGKLLSPAIVTQAADGFPGNARASAFRREPYHANAGSHQQAIRLWKGPVDGETAAVAIKYDDPDGVEQTLAEFRLVEGRNAQLLPAFGESWPLTAIGPGTVRITYTAGYADVPPALDQAVLMLVGHFYANREAVNAADRAAAVELPLGVEDKLARYRSPGIA